MGRSTTRVIGTARLRTFPADTVFEAADVMQRRTPATASVTELGDIAAWVLRRQLGWPLPDFYGRGGRDD